MISTELVVKVIGIIVVTVAVAIARQVGGVTVALVVAVLGIAALVAVLKRLF